MLNGKMYIELTLSGHVHAGEDFDLAAGITHRIDQLDVLFPGGDILASVVKKKKKERRNS